MVPNIAPAWTVERQRELLSGLGPEYVDVLGAAALKRKSPADLKQRAELLRPTSRQSGERIYVAALACIAWPGHGERDFLAVLSALAGDAATLVDMETGGEIAPMPDAPALAAAVEDYRKGFYRASTTGARDAGTKTAAAKAIADTEARIALIRKDWPLSEPSTSDLLAKAGKARGRPMAYKTAVAYLGSRKKAQTLHQAELKRTAIRAAKREKANAE